MNLLMNDQAFNIMFVGEVEKYPELYNYKLKEYSKKDITERAWNEVGKTVNLTIAECKEKWKNLRSVYVRRLKPPPPGSKNKTKPYYLSEAMKFTLPYVRIIGKPDESLTEYTLPTTPVESLPKDTSHNLSEDEDSSFNLAEAHAPHPPYPFDIQPPSHLLEPLSEPARTEPPTLIKKRKRDKFTDEDKAFKEYMDTKRSKIKCDVRDSQARKKFLASLLPEIEPLTEEQMRSFRRRVLQLIDDIRIPQYNYPLGLGDPNVYSPTSSSSAPVHAESQGMHTAAIKEEGQTSPSQLYPIVHCEELDPQN